MTVPGQGLSLITPHALPLIFLWRSRFVGALLRATRLELSFSQISAGAGRIAVPGWVARNGAPRVGVRGFKREQPWGGEGQDPARNRNETSPPNRGQIDPLSGSSGPSH